MYNIKVAHPPVDEDILVWDGAGWVIGYYTPDDEFKVFVYQYPHMVKVEAEWWAPLPPQVNVARENKVSW